MRTHHVDIHLLSFYTRTLIEMARIRYVNVVGIFALTLEIRDLIVDAPLSLSLVRAPVVICPRVLIVVVRSCY